jgi:hypothetical protein
MAYSATNIITWAKISQVLAHYDSEQKRSRHGIAPDATLHQKIWVEWQSLAWELAQDSASEYLYPMGNYVFSLCFPYVFEAMSISAGSGAPATPTTPTSGYVYNVIFKTVSVSANAPTAGTSTYTNNDLIGATDLDFIFINKVQYFSGEDFSFDNSVGTITMVAYTWFANDVVAIPHNQLV